MGEFQRSPSKVWWADEEGAWRAASASPGSQDSGFSDTETSPQPKKTTSFPKDFLKQGSTRKANLTSNVVEKCTPQKSINLKLRTPSKSEPVPVGRYAKNKGVSKVNRNLFRSVQLESTMESNQYARGDHNDDGLEDSKSVWLEKTSEKLPDCVKTLPVIVDGASDLDLRANLTAPANLFQDLDDDDVVASLEHSYNSSDCESELECLFRGKLESPRHTSTPKAASQKKDYLTLGRMHAMNLLQKYKNERVPPITVDSIEEGTALRRWMQELKDSYEPECMTTLQCKSIAGELADKVAQMAATATSQLRLLLYYNELVEREFDKLKNQKKHHQPLAQSLTGIIHEFLDTFNITDSPMRTRCDQLKMDKTLDVAKLSVQMHLDWNSLIRTSSTAEIRKLVENLEDPRSELDVRAKLTGLTSITLHNEHLIEVFILQGAVQVVTTLCEKCEGSSVRGLALRALSTLCVNAAAIRKFETSGGVQLLAETLTDEARPEPERTEAVALLAQITAPWIDDNHSVANLHRHSKKLVKHLTRLLRSTRCCQTVLLCTAALANLTTMDPKSVKYLLHNGTSRILLETIRSHGARASIYLLEQVAMLIANMSSTAEARSVLAEDCAPIALMCFLQTSCVDDDVLKRLQQKAIIGLSRLCGDKDAARQVVEMGGVDKLVKLCREKKERFDSDAILVAALATLRKITEACGVEVVNEEDAQELIQPRLLDSFMAYSAQSESLV